MFTFITAGRHITVQHSTVHTHRLLLTSSEMCVLGLDDAPACLNTLQIVNQPLLMAHPELSDACCSENRSQSSTTRSNTTEHLRGGAWLFRRSDPELVLVLHRRVRVHLRHPVMFTTRAS